MIHKQNGLIALLLLAGLCTACASSGYWIPPSSPQNLADSKTKQIEELPLPALNTKTSQEESISNNPVSGSDEPQNIGAGYNPTPAPFSNDETESLPEEPLPLDDQSGSSEQSYPQTGETIPSAEIAVVDSSPILYYAQAADSLPVVATRFGVKASEINSNQEIPQTGFINPGQLLIIPRKLGETTSSEKLLPDSEVVFSPSAVNFDIDDFVKQAGGYLSKHKDYTRTTGTLSGARMVLHTAKENSINPRLLLALIEYHSGWIYGEPATREAELYPLGIEFETERYLYNQLVWTLNQLSIGYYAYREGRFTEITFKDGSTARLAPDLNAGTAALQYYFAQLYDRQEWTEALYSENGFINLYERMFGDPWERARAVEPLYPISAHQPPLILPFERNWTWSLTGGPHGAWEQDGAYAALDFGPGIQTPGCVESGAWVLAASDGLVVRTGPGLVVLDLDGDGHESTGWVLIYLHVASDDRIPLGEWVATGDKLGHPSCEGGHSTGTHLHIARKYNGEWVPADGPLPFNLGGWIAHNGEEAYQGTLTRAGQSVTACTCSNAKSFITRGDDDP
ncbi:MAG: hypothetical protein ACK2TW_00875 [Anaerolineales bacterium]|jgi:murein DD-endopeptidase MepM/ murein hydrolase activator NlpD